MIALIKKYTSKNGITFKNTQTIFSWCIRCWDHDQCVEFFCGMNHMWTQRIEPWDKILCDIVISIIINQTSMSQ